LPQLASVFTTYGAATPQINLKLDRERAQALGVNIADIFSALADGDGRHYTNDFNLFGRTWQVKVQAEAADRATVNDVYRVRVRSSTGEAGALAGRGRCRVDHRAVVGHPLQQPAFGGPERRPRAGLFLGEAIAAMEQLAKTTPARRLRLRMTGTALQEKAASGQTGFIWGWRGVRLSLPGRPLRKHDHSAAACCRSRSACSAR